MGMIGVVLAMLVAVVISALIVRVLALNAPRSLVQVALGAVIAVISRTPGGRADGAADAIGRHGVPAGVSIASLLAASIAPPRLLRNSKLPPEPAHEAELDRARAAAAARIMELYRRRIEGRAQKSSEGALRIRPGESVERQMRVAGLRAERDALFALVPALACANSTNCRTSG